MSIFVLFLLSYTRNLIQLTLWTKLYNYGLGLLVNIFKFYLIEIFQFVSVNGILSNLLHVTIGVPEVSALDALFFITFKRHAKFIKKYMIYYDVCWWLYYLFYSLIILSNYTSYLINLFIMFVIIWIWLCTFIISLLIKLHDYIILSSH